MAENRKLIYDVFNDARAYYLARKSDPKTGVDSCWEAMFDVFEGNLPVFVLANDYRQIEQAVNFSKEYGFDMVLVGGRDAWMLTYLLKENNIPIIAGWVQGLPSRQDDGDIFDMTTQNVVLDFIEGRRVDLNNKHKELDDKYRQKKVGSR